MNENRYIIDKQSGMKSIKTNISTVFKRKQNST